ncbi:DUF3953 domain-containing protein [Paenibacillus polymyxa]|uniref:DUF3953 domain-containing protein n=1 Tax=Paenibacillus polymyxa TaxID=1406 RepID=UPI001A07AF1F|nr:DUF3953 domain-containing protein [Paenibacillus sp. EKM208P]WDM22901.1 DUF3953 domain-containing protein [Paenibacillus polymyxa]
MLKKMNIFLILKFACAAAVVITSIFSLAYTGNNRLVSLFTQLFLSLMFLFSGISEFKTNRRTYAIVSFSVSLFAAIVFISTLLLRKG